MKFVIFKQTLLKVEKCYAKVCVRETHGYASLYERILALRAIYKKVVPSMLFIVKISFYLSSKLVKRYEKIWVAGGRSSGRSEEGVCSWF